MEDSSNSRRSGLRGLFLENAAGFPEGETAFFDVGTLGIIKIYEIRDYRRKHLVR